MSVVKKAFAWDNEDQLGFIEVHSHKQIEVKRVCMNGKRELILLTEWKYFKNKTTGIEDWNAVKGMSVPLSKFDSIALLVSESLSITPEIEAEEIDNE